MATDAADLEAAEYLAEMRDRARTWAQAARRHDAVDRGAIRAEALRAIAGGDIAGVVAAVRALPPAELAPLACLLRRVGSRRRRAAA
jgi:hypothetical protein